MPRTGRGEGIRTPGPMLPKHVRYQTALHPGFFIPRGYFPQATKHIIHELRRFVNTFFKTFFDIFSPFSPSVFLHILHQKPKE